MKIMYRYHVNKRSPVSSWILDDTVPFQENSGSGATGDKKTGTADPSISAPLVAGAAFSSVFDSASIGQFQCNLFKQGLENRPFALEAWVNPVLKSRGVTPQPSYENISTKPYPNSTSNPETQTWALSNSYWSNQSTLSYSANGGPYNRPYIRKTITATTNATSNTVWVVGVNTDNTTITGTQGIPVEPNTTYTVSFYVRYSLAKTQESLVVAFFDAAGSRISTNATAQQNIVQNKWSRLSITFTTPSNATRVGLRTNTISTASVVGDTSDASCVMVYKGNTLVGYGDGLQPGWEWTGTAGLSTSKTTANVGRVNWASNPSLESNSNDVSGTAGSGGASTMVRMTDGGYSGTSYKRQTYTTSPTGRSGGQYITSNIRGNTAYTMSAYIRTSIPQVIRATAEWKSEDSAQISNLGGPDTVVPANTWTRVSVSATSPTNATKVTVTFYATPATATIWPVGSYQDIDAFLIEETTNTTPGLYFDGSFPGAKWQSTVNNSPSTLTISNAEQQILSHSGHFDGLSINGKRVKFSTKYLSSGEAACYYDLQEYRAFHAVGIHSIDKNELYINGEKVAEVSLTDAQKNDTYIATDNFLYSGDTTSSQEIAMNAVAFYSTLSGDQIVQNYSQGINVLPQNSIYPQFNGMSFSMRVGNDSIFLDRTWSNAADFATGRNNNVQYSDEAVVPSYNASEVSVAGDWTVGVPLDALGDTSIYGVMLSWSGEFITVDTSLDGNTWTRATSNQLVSTITNGYNPNNKDLWIRVSFAGGLSPDPAYLESLTVVGFRNAFVDNASEREVSVTYPAVLRNDYEPILYRDDNGIALNGGTMTIGTDDSLDPDVARTLEVWIKPIYGTPVISVAGTKYRNGVVDSTITLGEWSVLHYVADANISVPITISGDCIVGQVVLYPTALSAGNVSHIYNSYVGNASVRYVETNTTSITDGASPLKIYSHDWAIDAAG